MALFDESPLNRSVRGYALGQVDPTIQSSENDLLGNAAQRGTRQSLGLGADYAATLAEAAGQQQLSQDLYNYADTQMERAGRLQRGPQTLGDVNDLESAVRYGVNKFGESAPVSAAALGAGVAAPAAPLLTSAAATFPVAAGEISYSMRQDPNSSATVGERAAAATGGGAVNSVLEVLPEAGVLGRVLGNTKHKAAETMRDAVMSGVGTAAKAVGQEAATETGQEVVSRSTQSLFNPEIAVDPRNPEARDAYLESAAAGAAGGVGFGVPAGVAVGAQQAAGVVAQNIQDTASQTAQAGADATQAMREGAADIGERARVRVGELLTPPSPGTVRDTASTVRTAATNALSRFRRDGQASRINPNIPLSEVDAVVQSAAVADEAQLPEVRDWIVSARSHLSTQPLTVPMINDALNIFGERGYSVLRAITQGNEQAQQLIDQDQNQNGSLNNFIAQSLKPEYRETATPQQLRQLRMMIDDATSKGIGDVDEILSAAFVNPQEVKDALSTRELETATEDDSAEFTDTGAVEQTEERIFGDTTGNRRIQTGGLNIPYPVPMADTETTRKVVRAANNLTSESDLTVVPAHQELVNRGVDPAAVAAEMGIPVEQLRGMAFIKSNAPANTDTSGQFTTKLGKRTIKQLNNQPRDPSAGSYLEFIDPDGGSVALNLRSYIASKVYGKRTPDALLNALTEGVGDMLSKGYTLANGLPKEILLARYDTSGAATDVTLASAIADSQTSVRAERGESFPFQPEDFAALDSVGLSPKVDFTTGELYITEDDAKALIEGYAAAVASRNAAARGTAVPAWTQALIDKYGTDFPAELGRVSESGTFMADLAKWANDQGMDSRALAAITRRGNDIGQNNARARSERTAAERERQGPATGEIAGRDTDDMPASLVEKMGDNPVRDEPTKVSPRRNTSQQQAADRLEGRDPERKRTSFLNAMRLAGNTVRNMQWAVGDLPSGVDLQGKYAVLGKIAAKGEPLQFAVAAQTGRAADVSIGDMKKMVDAYRRRGFRMRTSKPLNVDIEGNIYSDAVTSRLLGANGDAPVHMVLTMGDTPSSRLANRLGIPVLDMTNAQQRKIAGDILRSYDRGMRQEVQRSQLSAEEKKRRLAATEERAGIDRVRDIVNAKLAKKIDEGYLTGKDMEGLYKLAQIVNKADNDFFTAAIEGRSMSMLLQDIDNLESVFNAYQKEKAQPEPDTSWKDDPQEAQNRAYWFQTQLEKEGYLKDRIDKSKRRNADTSEREAQLKDVQDIISTAEQSYPGIREESKKIRSVMNEARNDASLSLERKDGVTEVNQRVIKNLQGKSQAWLKAHIREKKKRLDGIVAAQGESRLTGAIRSEIDYAERLLAEQGKASRIDPGSEIKATPEQFAEAIEYIESVLHDYIDVKISELPGMSGLYHERHDEDGFITARIIELSVYAADPMSVAFHESMHALLKNLNSQKEQAEFIKVLTKAANAPLVMTQLRAKLKDHPAALEQINTDAEERIAYMYQLWAAGELNLSASVENWFTKLTDAIRSMFGILSNEDKAGLYLQAFKSGMLKDPSVVNDVVMMTLSGPERALRAVPVINKTTKLVEKIVRTSHGRLKSYGNPALDNIADAFYNDSSSGYLQTVRSVVTMYGSQFGTIMRGIDPDTIGDLATALHSGKAPTDQDLRSRYNQINHLMKRLYAYAEASGIGIGKTKDYFPQAWDKTAIEDRKQEFVQMLVDNAQWRDEAGDLQNFDVAGALNTADQIMYGREKFDIQEDLAGYSPFMEASMQRQIILKDRAKAAEFMDQDVVRVVTRYITQTAKRGEYSRHFGRDGKQLEQWITEALNTGVTREEITGNVVTAIKAMEGTLGHDINPTARAIMSGLVTWQNLAVLPLSVLSSLVDPMGIVVRGGTVEQAWNGFKAGVKNIPQSLKKNGTKSDMQEFAELVGTVESQMTMDMLGDMYGSAFMTDWARKTNNLLFRYNLMEGWNTAIRSAATVAAVDFIERHARGVDEKNSERWLAELGVSADSLVFSEDGKLLWSQRDIAERFLELGEDIGGALEKSRLTREAINRWVDGAVLRPHAAHRPAWGSDPRFMLIWHLKQFTYSFQKTILERVMSESKNGNYAPILALTAYVPFMIAADYLRGMIQGLGEEPDWRKDMTFGEIVWEGTQRAGLLGVRQFAMDGADNPMFALGPTAGYAWKATEGVLDGDVTDAVVAALPANVLWKGW